MNPSRILINHFQLIGLILQSLFFLLLPPPPRRQSLFAIVAAVLHLGNITHVEDQGVAKLSHNGHETYVADVSNVNIS